MIDNVADPGSAEAITCAEFAKAYFIDRREHHSPLVRSGKKLVPYTPKKRTKITGICLHQTACDMGERPARYDTISVHFVVLRSGLIVWTCDEDYVLFGGNGWNDLCVQIEVNGLYSGLEDDPTTAPNEAERTTWNDPSTPWREVAQEVTLPAMASLRMLVRYLKIKIPTIKVLVAHRQSSKDRPNDPGERIWRGEAVPLMKELGLTDGGRGFAIQTGKPIPEAWDPEKKGIKY